MTKIYVMSTCPDCRLVKEKLANNPRYTLIDIGEHVRNLKEFLRLRDQNAAFDSIKAAGQIGIPCILHTDGTVSFSTDSLFNVEETSSMSIEEETSMGETCSIDGTGC